MISEVKAALNMYVKTEGVRGAGGGGSGAKIRGGPLSAHLHELESLRDPTLMYIVMKIM